MPATESPRASTLRHATLPGPGRRGRTVVRRSVHASCRSVPASTQLGAVPTWSPSWRLAQPWFKVRLGAHLGGARFARYEHQRAMRKMGQKKHGSSRITTIHHSIFLRFFGYCGNFCPFFFCQILGTRGFLVPTKVASQSPRPTSGGPNLNVRKRRGQMPRGGG